MRDQRIPELGRPSAVVEGEDAHPAQVEPVDGVVLVAERNRVVEILLAVAAPVRVVPGVPLADPLLGITVGREVGDAGLRPDGGGIEVGRVDVIADQGLMCIGQVSDTTAAAVVRLAQDDLARRDARRVLGHRLGDVEAVGVQRRHGAEAVRRAVERGLVVVGPIHVVGHDKEGVDVRRQTGDVEEPGVVFGRTREGVDREIGAGRHRRAQILRKRGELVSCRQPVGAHDVARLVVDVDAVQAASGRLANDLPDRVSGVDIGQALTHVCVAVKIYGNDDPRARGVCRADE